MFKIEVLDTFINECQTSGNEISFEKFGSINESYSIGEQSVNIPQEIFEAYMKYADVTGTEMVTLNEFEKIKSFAEFIQDKEAEGDVSTEEPATEEPAAEEPAAEEPAAEEPAAEEPAAEEPAAEEPAAEEPAAEEPKKDEEELDLGLENLKANETVATQPEPVAPTKEETEDDERHQTKIDPETTDGQATADRVYDKINKMGEPAKDSAGTAGEKDGKHLEDLDATVAPVKENADLEDEGAQVKPKEGEEDDAENGTAVPQVATDGQKTAADIATQTMVMGEPETASAGDAGEKKGEKLEGEPENVTPVKETLGMDIAKVDDPEEEIDDKERLEAEEIEKQKNPVAEKKSLIEEDFTIEEQADIAIEELFSNFTELNEAGFANIVKAAAGSPIKFTKLKMMGKKIVAARINKAVADLDLANKIDKTKELDTDKEGKKEQTERLKAAHKIKTDALKDDVDALNDKMASIATNAPLKAVAQSVGIKAKQQAAQKLLKAADGEEAKQLKIELQELSKKEDEIIKNYQEKGTSEAPSASAIDGDAQETSAKKEEEKKS